MLLLSDTSRTESGCSCNDFALLSSRFQVFLEDFQILDGSMEKFVRYSRKFYPLLTKILDLMCGYK